MAEELVVTNLEVELSRYQRSMQTATKLAQSFDRQMLNVIGTLNRLEKTSNKIKPEIKFTTDTSSIDRAESDIKALDGMDAEINVTADTTKAESDIKALDSVLPSSLSFDVLADTSRAESDIKAVDDGLPSPTVQVDADVSGVEEKLRGLQALATLQIGIALAPGAADLLGKVTGLSGQQDTQVARSAFVTGTGGAEIDPETIDRLYAATGVAREEIAKAAAEVFNLTGNYETLEADTLSAFGAAIGSGSEVSAVIKAQSQLVRNDLVPNFQAAGDLLATGFNNNADRAGDFLDTIIEYAPNFKAMGFTGEQAVAGIVRSLADGTFNADKFGDTVKETGILINEALADPTGTKFGILRDLDLVDEAQLLNEGKIGFAEFFKGFQEASKGLSPAERNTAITELFGTPAEDLGFDIFANLDLTTPFVVADDAAQTMLDTAQNNLPAAFAELGRTFETEVINKILPIQDILDEVTEKINVITELLRGGMALPDALEIALEAPGLAATIDQFASTANNLILEFLLGVSNILEGLGQQGAADTIRGTVADASVGQLAYDIQVADDAVGVQRAIETAVRRGVDEAELSEALGMAAQDFVSEGQYDIAQALIDNINLGGLAQVEGGLTYEGFSVPFQMTPEMTPEEIDAAAREAVEAYVAGTGLEQISDLFKIEPTVREISTEEAEEALAAYDAAIAEIDAKLGIGDITGALETAQAGNLTEEIAALEKMMASEDSMAIMKQRAEEWATAQDLATEAAANTAKDGLKPLTEAIVEVDDATLETSDEIARLGVSVQETMGTAATNMETEGERMVTMLDLLKTTTAALSDELAQLKIPTVAGGVQMETNAGGGTIPAGGLSVVGEQGIELIGAGTALSVLNNRTTEAFLAGLSMAGGGNSTSNTNININVINNNQGMAARGGADTRIANMVRGFS